MMCCVSQDIPGDLLCVGLSPSNHSSLWKVTGSFTITSIESLGLNHLWGPPHLAPEVARMHLLNEFAANLSTTAHFALFQFN